jgi:hypothetical protein
MKKLQIHEAMRLTRRSFVAASIAGTAAPGVWLYGDQPSKPDRMLAGEIGITTGSFMQHLRASPELHKTLLLDLPKRMRDELGMRVIDLMTRTLPSFEPSYLDALRLQAEKHGCLLTNLKMNQAVDMASADADARRAALEEYRRTIDAAQRLGCRWVRPAPQGSQRPDSKLLAAGYRELIDYAAPKGISLLVENNAWMRGDPEAIPAIIAAVGGGIAAAPDTGNWTEDARYAGLAKAFPLAVTCDFKAFQLGPQGEHPQYDLKRCFQVGWDAGFRGPWCLEHFHETLDGLWRGFAALRDMLRTWMAA